MPGRSVGLGRQRDRALEQAQRAARPGRRALAGERQVPEGGILQGRRLRVVAGRARQVERRRVVVRATSATSSIRPTTLDSIHRAAATCRVARAARAERRVRNVARGRARTRTRARRPWMSARTGARTRVAPARAWRARPPARHAPPPPPRRPRRPSRRPRRTPASCFWSGGRVSRRAEKRLDRSGWAAPRAAAAGRRRTARAGLDRGAVE